MAMLEKSTPPKDRGVVDRRRDPVMAWSGVGAAVVSFAVLLVPHESLDVASPSAREVTNFFTANYTMQQAQPLMHSVAAILTLVFVIRLSGLLREVGGRLAADLVRAGGIALVGTVVVTMGWVAAVVTATGDLDGVVQWGLYNLGWDFRFRLLYLLPVVLLPAGWALRRSGSGGLGWCTLLLGGLTALAPLGYLGRESWVVQYPASILFLVWTAVTGLLLGWRGART